MSRPHDYTSIGGADRRFPATEWTRILDPSQKEAIISELGEKYWKPLYSYLRSLGFGNEKAKDLVQGFFTEKVLDRELIQQADRTRGKLRTFLLTAIRNYAINIHKKDKTPLELDETAQDPRKLTNPEAAFDRSWADGLLENVLENLQSESADREKTGHWQLFHEWLLEPTADERKPQMKDLCAKYGIESPAQAYHMIENMKRRFRSILRERLSSQVDSESDVDLEISNFLNIFQVDVAR